MLLVARADWPKNLEDQPAEALANTIVVVWRPQNFSERMSGPGNGDPTVYPTQESSMNPQIATGY